MKILLSLFILLPLLSWGHSGNTNSSGCHNETITGGYHCHNKKKSNNIVNFNFKKNISKSPTDRFYDWLNDFGIVLKGLIIIFLLGILVNNPLGFFYLSIPLLLFGFYQQYLFNF